MSRAFILGAGFSAGAGLPLSRGLLEAIDQSLSPSEEQADLFRQIRDEVTRTAGGENIEAVFHHLELDRRLFQQIVADDTVPGDFGPSERLTVLEALRQNAFGDLNVVLAGDDQRAALGSLTGWARSIRESDQVLTFNFDTVAERLLREQGREVHFGLNNNQNAQGIPVYKLHGSIDWITADTTQPFNPNVEILFLGAGNRMLVRAPNGANPGNLDLQLVRDGGDFMRIGVAGFGAFKDLTSVPGSGRIWRRAMNALREAEHWIVVGFSMSEFDTMARVQFARSAAIRSLRRLPLRVTIVDPDAANLEARYRTALGEHVPINALFQRSELVEWDADSFN